VVDGCVERHDPSPALAPLVLKPSPVWDPEVVNEHRIRFVGSSADALAVATAVADADGVDLTSSEPPVPVAEGRVRLDLLVEGPSESIAAALDELGRLIPVDSSIELDPS
jgi:hypothetical protein